MFRRKKVATAAVILVLLLTLKVSYSFLRFHHVRRTFDQIGIGFSRERVLDKLGQPNYHSGACLDDMKLSALCDRELVYSYPFAPWVPEYYVVDFSSDGRVLDREHVISP
jgi:hypothetical protein